MTEEKMQEAWQRALAAERDEEHDEAPIELTFHCSKDEMYLLGHEIRNLAEWIGEAKETNDDFRLIFDFDKKHIDVSVEYPGERPIDLAGGGVGWLMYMLPAMDEFGRALISGVGKKKKVSVTWVSDRDSRDRSIRE